MGFRVVRDIPRPDPDLIERLRGIPTSAYAAPATFGDSLAVDPAVQPLRDTMRLIGPAFTVLATSGDLLMPMYATTLAQAGDVLVIDAAGRGDMGIWGAPMALTARLRGLTGAVVDGLVFDRPQLAALELATFARGSTPISATAERPGSINVSVRIGGKVVYPGDLLVGDADGLIVIPRARLAEIAERVIAHWAEAETLARGLREGRTVFESLGLAERVARLRIAEEDPAGARSRGTTGDPLAELNTADFGVGQLGTTDIESAEGTLEPASREPEPGSSER